AAQETTDRVEPEAEEHRLTGHPIGASVGSQPWCRGPSAARPRRSRPTSAPTTSTFRARPEAALQRRLFDRPADVLAQGVDRARILDDLPAEALGAAAANVGVLKDRGERAAGAMLPDDVAAEARLPERPGSEEEIRVAAQASHLQHRTSIYNV